MRLESVVGLPEFVARCRDRQVLSAYIPVPATSANAPAEARTLLHQGLNALASLQHGATHAERIEFELLSNELMDRMQHVNASVGGFTWVAFAALGEGTLTRVVPSVPRLPIGPLVTLEKGARLAPLLALDGDIDHLVAIVDRQHARIYHVTERAATEVAHFETIAKIEVRAHTNAPPRQSFHPGTHGTPVTDAVARQTEVAYDRHQAHVVDSICAYARLSWILIGGATETARRVLAELPPDLRARAQVASDIRFETTIPAMRRIAAGLDRNVQAAAECEIVNRVLAEARSSKLAVLGFGPIRVAIALRAMRLLVISVRQIEENAHEVEEVIRAAMAQGTDVRFIHNSAAHTLDDEAAGAAATLRFPIAPIAAHDSTQGERYAVDS